MFAIFERIVRFPTEWPWESVLLTEAGSNGYTREAWLWRTKEIIRKTAVSLRGETCGGRVEEWQWIEEENKYFVRRLSSSSHSFETLFAALGSKNHKALLSPPSNEHATLTFHWPSGVFHLIRLHCKKRLTTRYLLVDITVSWDICLLLTEREADITFMSTCWR